MHLNTDRLKHTHQQSITICSWQKQELELTDVKQRQEGKNSSTVASEWVQVGEAVSLEKNICAELFRKNGLTKSKERG